MNLLTEIDGHKFNIGTLRSRLANIISEARDSELRVVAMTADDLIVALLAERTQAKQQFSLAEEGLANYAQEIERAKHDIERLMASVSGEANEVERLRAALERIHQERLTWAMTCACNSCQACDRLDEVIRGALPQTQSQSEKT